MSPQAKLLAGVELGGTKCVCILGTGPDDVRATERLPTGERETTLQALETVLERWRAQFGAPRALGIASFGPVDLKPGSPTWGHITSTSKPGWVDTDVAPRLARRLGVPVGLDTDVNGAALAEGRWGAARGLDDYAYVTVGTGIGVGSIVRGRSIFGMNHTELGHIRVARAKGDDFAGITNSFSFVRLGRLEAPDTGRHFSHQIGIHSRKSHKRLFRVDRHLNASRQLKFGRMGKT